MNARLVAARSAGPSRARPVENMTHDLAPIFKALADDTRRDILDCLRAGPRTTTDIVERFPELTRFGVMKHMQVLRDAGLITSRHEGRRCVNSLNTVPIRQIYERWVSKYEELWATALIELKKSLEKSQRLANKKT